MNNQLLSSFYLFISPSYASWGFFLRISIGWWYITIVADACMHIGILAKKFNSLRIFTLNSPKFIHFDTLTHTTLIPNPIFTQGKSDGELTFLFPAFPSGQVDREGGCVDLYVPHLSMQIKKITKFDRHVSFNNSKCQSQILRIPVVLFFGRLIPPFTWDTYACFYVRHT